MKTARRQLIRESTFKGTRYFTRKVLMLQKPWYEQFKCFIPRNLITFISRIRTFHTRAKVHLFDKNIQASPDYECGYPSQDLNHIFFHCLQYAEDSDKLIIDLFHSGFSPSFFIEDIAFSNNLKVFYALLHYTTRIKISV